MTGAAKNIGGLQAPPDTQTRAVHAASENLRYPITTGEPYTPANGDTAYLGTLSRFATRVAGAWVGNVASLFGRTGAVVAVAGDVTSTLLGVDTALEGCQETLGLTHGTDGQIRVGSASAINVHPLSGTLLPTPAAAAGCTFLDTSEDPPVLLRWDGTAWRLSERVEYWITPRSTVLAARASSPVAGGGVVCNVAAERYWGFPNAASASLGDIAKPPRRFSYIKIIAYMQTQGATGDVKLNCAVQGSGATSSGGSFYNVVTNWTSTEIEVSRPVVVMPETSITTALLTSTPSDLRGVGVSFSRDVTDTFAGEVRCRGIVVEFR